jgi:hypothetical protein
MIHPLRRDIGRLVIHQLQGSPLIDVGFLISIGPAESAEVTVRFIGEAFARPCACCDLRWDRRVKLSALGRIKLWFLRRGGGR